MSLTLLLMCRCRGMDDVTITVERGSSARDEVGVWACLYTLCTNNNCPWKWHGSLADQPIVTPRPQTSFLSPNLTKVTANSFGITLVDVHVP